MDMEKILGLPKGADYILLNTIYHKSRRTDKGYSDDAISLVLKNTKTNKKIVKYIQSPMIEGYIVKPEIAVNDELLYIPLDCVDKVDLSYKNVCKDLAGLMGDEYMQLYWSCIKGGRANETKNFHKWVRAFSTDVNIEDFYRFKCLEHFGEKKEYHLSKAYFDIESDVAKGAIDFKTGTGDAPVNAITYIHQDTKTVYTLLLRNYHNPLIEELEENLVEFQNDLNEKYAETFGELNYSFAFFDDELTLIKMFFYLVNTTEPDFLLAWNAMGFDILYLIHRIKTFGVDPATVVCDSKNFKQLECYCYIDNRNKAIKLKTDFFMVSSKTIYVDQMRAFAAVRKSAKEFRSYSLDDIAQNIIGFRKVDYSDVYTFRELPYKNYKLFTEYNIVDVLLLYGIEKKVNDIELMFAKSYSSATRFNKIFKESVFLRNKIFMEWLDLGLVLGNNHNIDYTAGYSDIEVDEDEEKFEGALKALTHHMVTWG